MALPPCRCGEWGGGKRDKAELLAAAQEFGGGGGPRYDGCSAPSPALQEGVRLVPHPRQERTQLLQARARSASQEGVPSLWGANPGLWGIKSKSPWGCWPVLPTLLVSGLLSCLAWVRWSALCPVKPFPINACPCSFGPRRNQQRKRVGAGSADALAHQSIPPSSVPCKLPCSPMADKRLSYSKAVSRWDHCWDDSA